MIQQSEYNTRRDWQWAKSGWRNIHASSMCSAMLPLPQIRHEYGLGTRMDRAGSYFAGDFTGWGTLDWIGFQSHFTGALMWKRLIKVYVPRDTTVLVCPTVRPSVTRRCCTKTAKRRITQKIHMDSSFLLQKISAKFQRSHPQRRRQKIKVGSVTIGDFRPLSRCISDRNGATWGHSYYGTLIGTRMHSIEWR